MKQADNKVLIIGKPGTSKTTFLAQLFNVLQRNKGRLKLRETPTNILAIENARKQLAKGKPTQSTPAEQNQTLQLSLLLGETPLDLEFPDYGGEQVKAIIRERKLGAEWVQMCRNSRTWLLFIRLHDHIEPHDVLTKAATEIIPAVGDDTSSFPTDAVPTNEAVELVELLQILLATRAIGIQQPIEQPRLKLVLTLWDELHTSDPPETILASRYPLLLSFARSNWAANAMEVWGLSAQGFRLDTEENQDKYLDNTPTGYAYVVPPAGAAQVNDLSLLFD
jgi:energy-coupling factor transporter ATP-binding protein EcfA2